MIIFLFRSTFVSLSLGMKKLRGCRYDLRFFLIEKFRPRDNGATQTSLSSLIACNSKAVCTVEEMFFCRHLQCEWCYFRRVLQVEYSTIVLRFRSYYLTFRSRRDSSNVFCLRRCIVEFKASIEHRFLYL